MSNIDIDEQFKKQAEEAERAQREREQNRGKGGTPRDYETIHWTALKVGQATIWRALGEKPDFHLIPGSKPGTSFDARVVNISKIITDKGKKIKVVLPLRDTDPDHVMWRIIDKVNEFEWVDKKRVPTHSSKTFFNIVNRNNLPEKAFGLESKGWRGSEFFLCNGIDRTMADWHKENKHTRLLSKNINVKHNQEGKEIQFITEGVPAYGFTNLINNSIIRYYGFWENFDIGIKRTGLTNPAYEVFNASKVPEMCGNLGKYVVTGPLTDEEKSWERYDLDKLFPITSCTKIWNNLQKTIMTIDLELGTHFAKEIQSLSEEEKKRWEEERKEATHVVPGHDAEDEGDGEDVAPEVDESNYLPPVVEAEEVRSSKKVESVVEDEDVRDISKKVAMVLPPAWDKLTEEEKAKVVGSQPPAEGSKAWIIDYGTNPEKKPVCPACRTKSPISFKHCPGCGFEF